MDREPALLAPADIVLRYLDGLERASHGLPPLAGGVRPCWLLDRDPISTTWWGWNVHTGGHQMIRHLHPSLVRIPLWHRRLERGSRAVQGIGGLVHGTWHGSSPHPHARAPLPGPCLAMLLPVEDPPGIRFLFRAAAELLATLGRLHHRGLHHGDLNVRHLVLARERLRLVWTDPVHERPPGAERDISGLASALLQLDPEHRHPLTAVLRPWERDPPGSVADALYLVRRAMSDHLLGERHVLLRQARRRGRRVREARLYRAVLRLSRSLPPPEGRCCLRADSDGDLALIQSDGQGVRGGTCVSFPPGELPVLLEPDGRLNALRTRPLLRAWARRELGDPALRRDIQERWGGSDACGHALTRWLAAQSRLRTLRFLLERRPGRRLPRLA